MKKDYDTYVTPQNTPNFRERRIIFLESMFFLLINLLVFSIVFPEEQKTSLVLFFVFLIFTIAQHFDARKDLWTWFSITVYGLIAISVTSFQIFTHSAHGFWPFLLLEILICCATAWFFLKKRPAK